MDFGLTSEQLRLIEKARTVAKEVLAPNAAEYDREARHPVKSFAALKEGGWYTMAVPKEYGGMGLDPVTYAMCMHEFGQACASTAISFSMHNGVQYLIASQGTPEQKERWFGRVVNDRVLMGSWGSEPTRSMSSIKISLGTSMVPADGGYRLEGQKYFCSLAGECNFALIYAVMQDKIGNESVADIIVGLVDTSDPGVVVDPEWDSLGLRATMSRTVGLKGAFMSESDILGPPGALFMSGCVQYFAIGHAASYAGIARAALDFATEFASKRKTQPDNVRTADLPWIQMHLGDLSVAVESAWLTVLQAAWQVDASLGASQANWAGIRAKVAAATTGLRVTREIFEITGGNSAMRKYPADRYFRDARMAALMAPSLDHCFRQVGSGLVNEGRVSVPYI